MALKPVTEIKFAVKCRKNSIGRRHPHVNFGNRCGHNPADPRFAQIQDPALDKAGEECDIYGRKFRPAILRDIGTRAKGIYHEPKKHVSWAFKLTDAKIKCNGANLIKDRSELREAKVAMLAVMALNMDLLTMRVGKYDRRGNFSYRTTQWLANQAGISLGRAKTVIRWMYAEGIMVKPKPKDGKTQTNQYVRTEDGQYRGRGSIKMLSDHLFDYFGVGGDYLEDQRDQASKRARGRREEVKLEDNRQAQAVSNMRREKALGDIAEATSAKRTSRKADTSAAIRLQAAAAIAAEHEGGFDALYELLKG